MIRAAGDPAQRFLATMRAVQAGLRCGSGAMCGRRQRLLTASGAGIAFDVGVLLVTGAIATDAIAVRDAPLRLRPFHRLWSFRVRLSAGPYAIAAVLIFPDRKSVV